MMASDNRPCPCSSGKPSWWEYDARGIELARVCEDCKERKLAGYRPEILTNPNYYADEQIEPDGFDYEPKVTLIPVTCTCEDSRTCGCPADAVLAAVNRY